MSDLQLKLLSVIVSGFTFALVMHEWYTWWRKRKSPLRKREQRQAELLAARKAVPVDDGTDWLPIDVAVVLVMRSKGEGVTYGAITLAELAAIVAKHGCNHADAVNRYLPWLRTEADEART